MESTFNIEINLLDVIDTIENTISAWVMNIAPRMINWYEIEIVSEKRKLGKYAKKKIRTLGFIRFI